MIKTTMVQSNEIYLYECNVPYEIMHTIASVERHPAKEIGYPFLISFNSKKDSRVIKQEYDYKWLDSRTIDCGDKKSCSELFSNLKNLKIYNLDSGAFQINYKYHKYKNAIYFNLKDSYIASCEILSSLIKRYGYSWDTIAKYHSFTKKHKDKYLKAISKILAKKEKNK